MMTMTVALCPTLQLECPQLSMRHRYLPCRQRLEDVSPPCYSSDKRLVVPGGVVPWELLLGNYRC
jgi:hypothetical protein